MSNCVARRLSVLGIAWALGFSLAAADEKPVADAERDAKAIEVLQSCGNYLKDLNSFGVNIQTDMDIQAEGMKMQMNFAETVRVQRPNKLYMATEAGGVAAMAASTMVSDSKTLYTYMPALKRYTETEAPATLSEMVQQPMLGADMSMDIGMRLMADDPAKALTEGIRSASYVGEEKIDEASCHHIKVAYEVIDWDVWVAAEGPPLLRKAAPDFQKMMKAVMEQMGDQADPEAAGLDAMFENVEWDVAMRFNDWKANPQFTAEDFAFTPPEGAEKVDSLLDDLDFGDVDFGDMELEVQRAPHPLLGKAAPKFELERLDGGTAKLADHQGQDVVMLDFWATWCGPCRAAMPSLANVAEKYSDRGLVFYAVNIQEDAETIREMLTAEKLEIPVVLDADGSVAQSYGANAIPQTVLIGKDGSVQVVHVGAAPNLEEKLSQQVEDLLDGKDLAAKELQESETQEAENDSARRRQLPIHLKQIAIAAHNFYDMLGRLPGPAITDEQGQPLISWRVQLLPLLDQIDLYNEFRLDEPWDSEHNRKLIDRMPSVFQIPGQKADPQRMTCFVAPLGKETVWGVAEGRRARDTTNGTINGETITFVVDTEGRRFRDITDGMSNTILLVEVDDDHAVIWTKPDDYEYDPKQPKAKLGGHFEGGFYALLADGSVHFFSLTEIPDATLRAMFTYAGGEPFEFP